MLAVVCCAPAGAQEAPTPPTLPRVASLSTNGTVYSLARSGNRVFLGGSFTLVSPTTGPLAALDPATGRLRRRLPDVTGSVNRLAPDGAGGFYLAGDFTKVGGLPRRGLAHVLADGRVDPTFKASADNAVSTMVVGNGRVFLGGGFKAVNGRSRNGLAAVDASTGNVVEGFDPNPSGDVRALRLAGNRLFVGGSFGNIAGSGRSNLAVLDATSGAIDASFDPAVANPGTGGAGRPADVNGPVNSLLLAAGRLYVGGDYTSVGRVSRRNLAAMSPSSGALEGGFDPSPPAGVFSIAFDGSRLFFSSSQSGSIRAVDAASGAYDAAFQATDSSLYGVQLAVSGGTLFAAKEYNDLVALDSTTGKPAEGFEPAVVGGHVLALLAGGNELVIGGSFAGAGGERRERVAALDAGDGSLTSFAPKTDDVVTQVAASGRRLFLRGHFRRVQGRRRSGLASVNSSTGALGRFAPRIAGVRRILPAGRRVFVGGGFRRVGRIHQRALVALSARTGRVDRRFRPRIAPRRRKATVTVNALAVRGGRLYLGGAFSRVNHRSRRSIAAIGTRRGSLVRGFRASVRARSRRARAGVLDLHLIGRRLFVGGKYSILSGHGRSGFGAVSARTGRLDRRFGGPEPVSAGPVTRVGDKIYVTDFTGSVDEISSRSGTLLRRFAFDNNDDEQVLALAPIDSGLLAGGAIDTTSPATNAPGRIARLVRFDLSPGATP